LFSLSSPELALHKRECDKRRTKFKKVNSEDIRQNSKRGKMLLHYKEDIKVKCEKLLTHLASSSTYILLAARAILSAIALPIPISFMGSISIQSELSLSALLI
jgi:hypothetical protein